jgi:hypothetical protein
LSRRIRIDKQGRGCDTTGKHSFSKNAYFIKHAGAGPWQNNKTTPPVVEPPAMSMAVASKNNQEFSQQLQQHRPAK